MSTGSKRRRRLVPHGTPEAPQGTGGTITQSATSNIHTFDAAANFTPAADGYVDVLIIAGGGGGGDGQDRTGGGGGAGGVRFIGRQAVVKNTAYPIVIGAGGAGGIAGGAAATNGANSSAFGVASTGGGHGDGFSSGGAAVGGSGGGSRHGAGGAAGTAGQGFAGGTPGVGSYPGGDANANFMASGGGGSSEVGHPADGTGAGAAGAGGNGAPYYVRDASENFAGGGGGGSAWYGSAVAKSPSGAGGSGGGGAGGQAWAGVGVAGVAGTDGTGGGGGGGGRAGGNGAAGGSGRVIVRYSRMNASLYDDFNRADNAVTPGPADSGQPVLVLTGTAGISGNQLVAITPSNVYWDAGTRDFRHQFKIALLPAGKAIYAQFRSDVGETQLDYISLDATGMSFQEFSTVPASDVTLQASAIPILAGDVIDIIAKGLNVKILVNGALRLDVAVNNLGGGSLFGISLDVGATVDWMRGWKI